MRYFDCHSHFSTKAGLHHASQEEYEQAQRVFKRKRTFETEQEMADGFRKRNVRTILDIYRTWRMTDEDEIRRSHDYVIDFARKNPDIVYGNWVAINPVDEGVLAEGIPPAARQQDRLSMVFARARTRCTSRRAIRSGTPFTNFQSRSARRCC